MSVARSARVDLWGILLIVPTPEDAAAGLQSVTEDVFHALRAGLALSQRVHQDARWEAGADIHLALHLVRREAVERLRSVYNATSEPTDNLDSVMSGIVLAMPSSHVLRVWHTADGELPPASTQHRKAFYHQQPSANGNMPVLPAFVQDVDEDPSNLAILWNHNGLEITRFDLIRPMGLNKQKALEDWRLPLLSRFVRVNDIDYGEESGGQSDVG